MAKVYAVRKGTVPGIYATWAECQANVKGFSGAEYQSFMSLQDAEKYMNEERVISSDDSHLDKAYECLDYLKDNLYITGDEYLTILERVNHQNNVECNVVDKSDVVRIYVDGSYNGQTEQYGYGIYIIDGENEQMLMGNGPCREGGRNVEGEVAAACEALHWLKSYNICKPVEIYHDYMGIGKWADETKPWSANCEYTSKYADFVKDMRKAGYHIDFVHVNGHTGVAGNEVVDKLAKLGCGLELTHAECKFMENYSAVSGFPKDLVDDMDEQYS